MRSRTVREGSVGLMILAGVGLFGGLVLWIKGLNPANQSFTVYADFAAINGVQTGSAVRYRGVNVGRIETIVPGPNGVEVRLEITRSDLAIPKDSDLSVNQTGLLGETVLDITPRRAIPETAVSAGPRDRNCDRELILCQNSRIRGVIGISTDELIRATIRFADTYSNPQFTGNINTLTKNSSEAASEIARLSREVTGLVRTARTEVRTFSSTARSIANTADQATLTIAQINELITANRSTLVSTLDNLSATSTELRGSVARFSPLLNQVEGSNLLRNLETLSANAAQTSANLRDVSATLNNPTTVTMLQQTLDSARATFENTQKITSDLDELTGDPKLRDNLRRLINGLSGLVSSTQQLQQQAEIAQILAAPTAQPVPPQSAAKPIDTGSSTP
ncbi:MCE family protein [Cyanobacteria bacterium FACHB-DQ100]|uniref:MlaD family protein n=1 Tax=Leptolyngbya sp. DQ-M1 TaxID=2933920 RepID=UPI0019A5E92B|nr:MCE family protein [Cyanobacteria bacterium FACHB-DQ100]